ncbi:MAG: tetratricopeptide repeat protein [Blastocatellia bacterium]|nr:tetratricopeptide repeat protein [Blastocatellia bacterium]
MEFFLAYFGISLVTGCSFADDLLCMLSSRIRFIAMSKKSRANKISRARRASPISAAPAAPIAERPANNDSTQHAWPARWRKIYVSVPALLALLASINTLWNGFATDDHQQILNNEFIKKIGNLPLAFTTSVWSFATSDIAFAIDSYYRPVFNVLLTINYALFGTSAWGWHLVNVLIHTAVTLLVFVIFKELTGRKWLAVIAASLFAVHPTHAESIAWVSGVTDPLTSLFFLSAFYFYIRFRERGRKGFMAVASGLYFLALLGKETALTLPILVAYSEFFYFKESAAFKQRMARILTFAFWFAVPTAIYFLMRYQALGGILFGSSPRYPLGPALATVPLAMTKYLALMLIPSGYSYQHYTDFIETFASLWFIAPLAFLIVLAGGIAAIRSRVLRFAAVWFVVTLAPALAVLRQFDPEYLVQERYLYLPSMGFCLAVALGVRWLAARKIFAASGGVAAYAITVVILIVWGAIYMTQNRVWQDTITVYKNSVAGDPDSPVAHTSLAISYYNAGRPREAEQEALTALALDSECAYAYLHLSYFAHRSGNLDKAIEYLERGAAAIPEGHITRHNLATINLNLGLLYAERKDMDRAEKTLLRSIEIWPRAVGYYHTGQFYFNQGRFEDAREMFEQTLRRVPSRFAMIHLRLGQVYELLGRREQARASYQKYLEFAPPNAADRAQVMNRLSQL